MDAQRPSQAHNDNDSKNKYPHCKTPLAIEKHASEVYTNTVFYEFQDEVHKGCFSCDIEDLIKENEQEITIVKEDDRRRTYEVVFNCTTNDTRCSCKMFERKGIPCRHMSSVWKRKRLELIPEKYVLNRWTKMATKKPILGFEGNIMEQCARMVDRKKILNDLWSEIHSCVSLAEDNEEDLSDLVKSIHTLRLELEAKKSGNVPPPSKTQDIEFLIGAIAPTETLIKPPKISKNKESGPSGEKAATSGTESDKWLKGDKEKAIEQQQKKKRVCRGCGELGYHDIRNCPEKLSS